MKFKKILFILPFLFVNIVSFSQQIGSGYASTLTNFNIELPSGFYQGLNPNGKVDSNSHDWNHLINLRHSNLENNNQLQIASSYFENDRLFFRKFVRGLGSNNPVWYELATRGGNTFNGDQSINGTIAISGSIRINESFSLGGNDRIVNWSNFSYGSYIDVNNSQNALRIRDKNNTIMLEVNGSNNYFTGNVGIGTTFPDQKLTVNGTIHSKEVIVDTNITPDYVFQKYYTGKSELKEDYVMPTLTEIENFTKKNNHLPGVPSAKEMQEKGISLGEMSNILLQKIEELTLYTIEQQKELERLRAENENYKSFAERLATIEKELKK
ncbi:tail fiber protein [Flavobacterium pectinovorum]|uniref:tail fiber protein n=1 Tax=Flavobacterium pectinovorum TaxID=29533 RepID=UPI001FAD86CF|nr:tail fiber protein [Flavobacterium pectinovorum]MCI9844633.1 hypothetical protein [Flavobacterium pectinovorum]